MLPRESLTGSGPIYSLKVGILICFCLLGKVLLAKDINDLDNITSSAKKSRTIGYLYFLVINNLNISCFWVQETFLSSWFPVYLQQRVYWSQCLQYVLDRLHITLYQSDGETHYIFSHIWYAYSLAAQTTDPIEMFTKQFLMLKINISNHNKTITTEYCNIHVV